MCEWASIADITALSGGNAMRCDAIVAQINFMRQMSTAYGSFHISQPGVAGVSSIKNIIKKRRSNEERTDERRKTKKDKEMGPYIV